MIEINSRNIRTWSKLGQKGAFFGDAIFDVVEKNDNTMVVTADLAYLTGLDRFIKNIQKNL